MPEWWKKSIESGSPPCSPQTPSLRCCLRLAAQPRAHPHQLADAGRVDRLERRAVDDLALEVGGEELRLDVVAREAERRLREVVRAEREEVGVVGDLVGQEARARQLDHRADEEVAPDLAARARARRSTTSSRISSSSAS